MNSSETNLLQYVDQQNQKFDKPISAMMSDKIYSPYCISNSMVLKFQDHCEQQLFSISDIMKLFISSKNKSSKYYFKVFMISSGKDGCMTPKVSHEKQSSLMKKLRNASIEESDTHEKGKNALSRDQIG